MRRVTPSRFGEAAVLKEDLHAKLRRLRREGERTGEEAGSRSSAQSPSQAPGLPPWLGAHLDRRRAHAAAAAGGTTSGAGLGTLGRPGDLTCVRNARGAFLVRERRLGIEERHGDWALSEVTHINADDLALLAKDEALASLDPKGAVYLDIETTGLSGGAGTTSFLVALGWFEGLDSSYPEVPPHFVLWQGFLEGPEEEPALLFEVARRVAASSGVVSFFGKSFDRHRLEDKMRIHGIDPPFAARPHLDLYHPLRRLYAEDLPNGKLQTMERALCEVRRQDDLPGSFAPAAWFDFLAGRAHRLEDVFRHNADDVLSLVVLSAHLGRSLKETRADGSPLSGSARCRAKGLVRVLDALRRRPEALTWLHRLAERGPTQQDPIQHDPAFERICARVRRTRT